MIYLVNLGSYMRTDKCTKKLRSIIQYRTDLKISIFKLIALITKIHLLMSYIFTYLLSIKSHM